MNDRSFLHKAAPWLALAGIAGVVYLSFEWAIGAAIHNRKVVKVPDLAGKSISEALSLLRPLNLGLSKDGEQFDKAFPSGTVIRQNPVRNMDVREGRIVRVIISQGGESLYVPDLVGQPLRNAQTALQNAGLNLGEIERRPSIKYEKDVVMASDPPASQPVSKNSLVSLIVSAGAPGADVLLTPDFIGKTMSDVQTWATSHRVTVTSPEENDISKGSGEVLNQQPMPDTPIRLGENLTVIVNASGNGLAPAPKIRYQLPAGGADRDVKVFVVDESGEREVFRKAQAPGSVVELSPEVKGRARARIFVNGIMVQEVEIQ